MSRIIDDAREKIKSVLITTIEWACKEGITDNYLNRSVDELIALSGTTDIECPECIKGMVYCHNSSAGKELAPSPKCDNGTIKHEWKVSVTLENGELPGKRDTERKDSTHNTKYWAFGDVCKDTQLDMLNEGWVKKVREVV